MFSKIIDTLIGRTVKKDVTVLLDNGHGVDTLGKRSPLWPDGSIMFEFEFSRNITKRVRDILEKDGVKCKIIVPEEKDVSLKDRVRRVNDEFARNNKCFLVSVHANAGGGSGIEVWTSVGKTKSDDMASIIWQEMKKEFPDQKMRLDMTDGDVDKEKDFYILKNTKCPAVLTENFFMDTYSDCKLIMSEQGRERIAKAHARAIKRIIQELY